MDHVTYFNTILHSFKIKANCTNYQESNNYFYYDIVLHAASKVKDVTKFSNEIALSLKSPIPNFKIIPEQGIIRLEFSKVKKETVSLSSLLKNISKPENFKIPCLLGEAVDGSPVWMDLSDNPHMIVAGTTGSGKSSLLHNIIANIIKFSSAKLYLVDPKQIEFGHYSQHVRIYETYNDTLNLLKHLIRLMDHRYQLLRNNKQQYMLPQVLIIDEFASLIMQDKDNEFYSLLCQLAQKCRAANIFIILATQRPSVQIINGNIKANFPARIACRVASQIDSKIILDEMGAENLSGKGDAFLKDNHRLCQRFQIAYISPQEIISMIQ